MFHLYLRPRIWIVAGGSVCAATSITVCPFELTPVAQFLARLRLAEVFGVTTFQLEQESGQQGRLLKRVLEQTGEVSEIELPKRVEDRVGLVRDVRVLPGYDVVAFGELSSMIRDQTIRSQLDGPLESWHIDIAVPQFVRQWSRVEERQPVSSELDRLEGLCRQPTVNFDWCPPDLDHAEVLRVDEEYVRRAFENTSQVERHGYDQSVRVTIRQDGDPVVRSVDGDSLLSPERTPRERADGGRTYSTQIFRAVWRRLLRKSRSSQNTVATNPDGTE